MYNIIPAKDATPENFAAMAQDGRDKLVFLNNWLQSPMYHNMISKAIISFVHYHLPGAVRAGRKKTLMYIYPNDYGLANVYTTPESTAFGYKAITATLTNELSSYGYKVKYLGNDNFEISWE